MEIKQEAYSPENGDMSCPYLSVLPIRINPQVERLIIKVFLKYSTRTYSKIYLSIIFYLSLFSLCLNYSMGTHNAAPKEQAPSIEIKSLSYAFQDGSSGLQDVVLSLPPGSRTLLIGGILSLSCLLVQSLPSSLTFSSEWRW